MKQKDGFIGERSIVLPQMIIDMEKADPLVSSLYITDIGYYPHARGHYRERKVPIAQHVLIYCVDGAGWYSMGNSQLQRIGANQFVILPAGKPHAYHSDTDNPWTIYWVHFTGTQSDLYARGAMQPQDVKPGIYSRINHRNDIFEEIYNTLSETFSRDSLRYVSSMLHYYLASMRYLNTYRMAGNRIDDGDVVAAAVHYMNENMERRLTLKEIAKYTGYSSGHFSAMFKHKTGNSPLAYYNRLKIEQACRMLVNTKMRINQICHKVGFDDNYYFSRMFTRIVGISPRRYREDHSIKNEEHGIMDV